MQTQSIPLNQLFLSHLNARPSHEGDGFADLLPLIRVQGVVQNLVVIKAAKGEKKKGTHGVVAGGRRLACLQKLAREGAVSQTQPVDCRVVAAAQARAISLAENTARRNMHPAEEFAAFKALVDSGTSVEDVAATFGVTPTVVLRRLRLCTVSPRLLADYCADRIRLDQLMALAITDDHAAQETAWFDAPEWNRRPEVLREVLTRDEPSADGDRRMRLVGLAAYLAAGGRLRADLFAEEGRGSVLDVPLLDCLARVAMADAEARYRAEGWGQVHLVTDPNGTNLDVACVRVQPVLRDATPEEAAEQATIETRVREIDALLDGEDQDGIDAQALDEERDGLDERLQELEFARETYSAEQKAKGHVVVRIDRHGKLCAEEGLVPRGEAGVLATTGSAGSVPPPRERAVHSERLVQQLSAHRSVALAAVVCDSPRLALVGLLADMVGRVFGRYVADTGVKVSISPALHGHRARGDDIGASPAMSKLDAQHHDWVQRMGLGTDRSDDAAPGDDDALDARHDRTMDWLMAQDVATLNALLAYCVATSIDVTVFREDQRTGDAFAQAAQLNMAQWWTATGPSYFQHVAKPHILAAVRQAGAILPEGCASLKKEALAEAAAQAVAGTYWLPPMLRVG